MIIAYADDHAGTPPASWDDLAGYETRAAHLIPSWDFATVRRRFEIDFEILQSLSSGGVQDENPPVISTRAGVALDLGRAQPNWMIASYFRTKTIPERAQIFGEWTRSADGTRSVWKEFSEEFRGETQHFGRRGPQ